MTQTSASTTRIAMYRNDYNQVSDRQLTRLRWAGLAVAGLLLVSGCSDEDPGIKAARQEAETALDQAMTQLQRESSSTSLAAGLTDFQQGWSSHIYRVSPDATDGQLGMAFVGVAEDPSTWLADSNVYVRGCVSVTYIEHVSVSPEVCPEEADDIGLDQYSPTFPQVDLKWPSEE